MVILMETRIETIKNDQLSDKLAANAAKLLDKGTLVAFPTETVYGIGSRTTPDAIEKLNKLKNRHPSKHYTLHIAKKQDVLKYVPQPPLRAVKLIKNTWPGPVTIVFQLSDQQIKDRKDQLAPQVFDILYKDNTIGIRCPSHPVAVALLAKCVFPIVAPSANIADMPPATTAEEVKNAFDGQIPLILDAGKTTLATSSTVVKAHNASIQILRAGPVSEKEILEKSTVQILFVCTGNSCRSPMAQAIFAHSLAEKLRCTIDKLPQMGYKITSAGTMQIAGMPASCQAVEVCAARGIDISQHKSTAVDQELIESSDIVLAMTKRHIAELADFWPEHKHKYRLLAQDADIADPIGWGRDVYEKCAQNIKDAVDKIIDRL
jgi:L-threonylcarbamoyladenylate synthase